MRPEVFVATRQVVPLTGPVREYRPSSSADGWIARSLRHATFSSPEAFSIATKTGSGVVVLKSMYGMSAGNRPDGSAATASCVPSRRQLGAVVLGALAGSAPGQARRTKGGLPAR